MSASKINLDLWEDPRNKQMHDLLLKKSQEAFARRNQLRSKAESDPAKWVDYTDACRAAIDADKELFEFVHSMLTD